MALAIKRIIDIIGALLGIILLSPVFLVIACAIKVDSEGPVFFRQKRISKSGKPFTIWKFRSMIRDAETQGLGYNVKADDPRITRVGKFLRVWALDELPQFINILKNDMSLVGPRAALPYQVEHYTSLQRKRLLMKPGITGLAQIKGRNILSWEERIKLDVWYVQNWSLLLDIKIILQTPIVLLSGKGIYGKRGINDPFI